MFLKVACRLKRGSFKTYLIILRVHQAATPRLRLELIRHSLNVDVKTTFFPFYHKYGDPFFKNRHGQSLHVSYIENAEKHIKII